MPLGLRVVLQPEGCAPMAPWSSRGGYRDMPAGRHACGTELRLGTEMTSVAAGSGPASGSGLLHRFRFPSTLHKIVDQVSEADADGDQAKQGMAKVKCGINGYHGPQADKEPDQALEEMPARRGGGLVVRQEAVGPGRAINAFLNRRHAFLVIVGVEVLAFSVAGIDCQHGDTDAKDSGDDGNQEGHCLRFHRVLCFLLVVCAFLLSPATS
jgi:hypothetical protein